MARDPLPPPRWASRDVLALAALFAVAGGLIVNKVIAALAVGPAWDTYAFLADAAEFAGRGFGYSELHRPPLLAALTALAFRLGAPMTEAVIQWIDGALALVGILAYCLLLRRRLGLVYAIVGALALLTVPPLWAYVGAGYTDIAALGLSALLLLVLVKATEDTSRWYLLAGPLFVAAALTRHTALLVALPAFVWLLLRWRPFRQAKHLAGALLLAALAYLPAAQFYEERFGEIFFPFVIAAGIADEFTTATTDVRASGEALYYVRHLPDLLGPGSLRVVTMAVVVAAAMGLLGGLILYFRRHRATAGRLALATLAGGPAVAAQVAGGLVARQLTLAVAILVVWHVLAPREGPARSAASGRTAAAHVSGRTAPAAAFDAMMLAWLLAYLDLHQHQAVQDARYFIPMAPGVIYFVVRGWSLVAGRLVELSTRHVRGPEAAGPPAALPALASQSDRAPGGDFWSELRHRNRADFWSDEPRETREGLRSVFGRRPCGGRLAAAAVPAALALVVAVALATTVATTPRDERWEVTAARDSAAWLLAHDPDVASKTLYSDLWPQVSWYLRANVRPMPFFKDEAAFAHELEKARADYYVTTRTRRFANYRVAAAAAGAAVLARDAAPAAALPRIAYIGKAWANYLEQVTDFRFYLMADGGKYGWEGTAFLDSLSARELAQYDAVAVYDVRWHDRYAGEDALEEYVERGGCVVMDASSNLGEPASNLGDTVMFDTVIRRAAVPASASIRLSAAFAGAHPEIAGMSAAAFVAPDGGAWFGADYAALPGSEPLQVLAWLGDRPAVAVRHVGAGRVYFIAANLVWHAFVTGSADEARLVTAVFDEAVDHVGTMRAQLSTF